MEKELLKFIRENNLSPFNKNKTQIKTDSESIYKTKDAKIIHNKLLSTLSSKFYFSDTSNLFNFFSSFPNSKEKEERQEFFEKLKEKIENNFLNEIKEPKRWWNHKYSVIAVTEDEKTFNELQKKGCPTRFLITPSDLDSLEDYDIVQIIDCEGFSRMLEGLPQSVFIDSVDEAYLERHLKTLSGWTENIKILKQNKTNKEILPIVNELEELSPLLDDGKANNIKKEDVESSLIEINKEISSELKGLTVSGESLYTMLSKSSLPDELNKIIEKVISQSKMPENLFTRSIPVSIEEKELESLIKNQGAKEHTNTAEKIKRKAEQLRNLPKKLQDLSDHLLLFDFLSGLSNFTSEEKSFPENSNEMIIESSINLFLDNAQPISFHLNDENRCSILTGANSGGKTTLLEHIIQLISLTNLGLRISGKVKIPAFSEIYYFAKNKGATNKGAFENLLLQMSKIEAGKNTLILADEIESVTEPGVAGAIVCATADYFIKKGCFIVIATHLGKEIQKNLPQHARIDGIEAKGLDENYDLIVDHNPVLGRLANSTPELIIKKMANSHKGDYLEFIYKSIIKD